MTTLTNRPARRPRPQRRGFTLVELLVVIVIIGILVGLISGAAIAARKAVRRAMIRTEISQLEAAIQEYKNQYGDYPPDFAFVSEGSPAVLRTAARQAVIQHLRKAFPRYPLPTGTDDAWTEFRNNVLTNTQMTVNGTTVAVDVSNLDAASALVFWLGGLPDPNSGIAAPAGFSENPQNPFQAGKPRKAPLFEFKPDRFVHTEKNQAGTAVTGYLRYYPVGFNVGSAIASVSTERAPYVYFKARPLAAANGRYEYAYADGNNIVPVYYYHGAGPAGVTNAAVPYLDQFSASATTLGDLQTRTNIRTWRSPETFQIICAGLDGQFGSTVDTPGTVQLSRFRFSKTGTNFAAGGYDFDNQTSFAEGTLEDEMQ